MEKYRVLVVDDFEPWRRFVCSTLEQQRKDVEIVGESSDGWEAIEQAEELHPDLIMLDVGLPTLNGIETARRLRRLSPCSKILFVMPRVFSGSDRGSVAYGRGGLRC